MNHNPDFDRHWLVREHPLLHAGTRAETNGITNLDLLGINLALHFLDVRVKVSVPLGALQEDRQKTLSMRFHFIFNVIAVFAPAATQSSPCALNFYTTFLILG